VEDNGACARITQWASDKAARLWAPKGPAPAEVHDAALEIGLSRLGEVESTEAAGKLLSEFLIINAGRKTSQRVWWRSGKATLANFDYQAQRLGIAEVYAAPPGSLRRFDVRVRQEVLTPGIPDDPEVAALLAPHMASLKKKGKQRVDIEYWTMPECPACAQARPEVQKLAAELGSRAAVSVHFVLHKEDDGKLRSLRGDREYDEAAVQAVVQRHYPGRIWDWMAWRAAHPAAPWQDGARELGLLAARIRGALATGEAAQLLEADFALAQQRRVNGAPTLVIANRLYDDHLERLRVLRVVCGLLDDPKPGACKDVPACFHDAQCRKRGSIGRCIDPGKPTARCDTSRPAVKVPATVVIDRECIYSNHERIMEVLIADLPGIEYRVLDITAPEAQELARKAAVARLPAYFLDPVARTEAGFAEGIGRVLRDDKPSGTLVLEGAAAVGGHRVLNRPRLKGRVDLFVAPLSKFGQEALETALEFKQTAGAQAPELMLHSVLYWTRPAPGKAEQRELAAANGLAEIEESARTLAVQQLAPDKLYAYLLERGKKRGSSYWDAPLRAVGLDPAAIRALAEQPAGDIAKALYAEADLLKSLDAAGEIVLLAENCELVPIRSRRDLRDVLERVGPSR
jgi:protein-disulfide isomerase